MTDSEMGNKATKSPSVAAAARQPEVEVVLPSTMNTVYTLRFSGNVIRWKDYKEVRSMHVRHARYDLENKHDWEEWLRYTMRDALVNECERATGQTVHMKSEPPVANIVITLDPRVKRYQFAENSHTKISGTLQWRSVATDSVAMRAAVDWRLGDRMAYYGIQDEEERWTYIFNPGEITNEPHTV